ncbi:MAG TPA: response regulator [Candidatus Binatia bacterium]
MSTDKSDIPRHDGPEQEDKIDRPAPGNSGDSSAEMRHTLRTPLNHIIGYSEMLLEEAGERALEDFAADLQKIHAAGKRLQALIDDLLDPTGRERAEDLSGTTTAILRSDDTPDHNSSAERRAESENPAGHLLVIDDNEGNRDMLSRRLRHQGYRVSTAVDGQQGLDFLKTQLVDLILLDVMMPGMDGYDVLKELKANNTWRDIPVIMVSALGEIESVVRCIEQGAEDYLTKPFDPVLLRARLGACLEKKRLRDQEVLYLKDVAHVTDAAAAVEAGKFAADGLANVVNRPDELGQLARVFQRMAHEVVAREKQLKLQIQVLRIEIDQAKKTRQVSEITDTEYFQELQKKAKALRSTS